MSNQPNLGAGIGTAHSLERRSVIAAFAVAGIAGPARHCTRWEGWCRRTRLRTSLRKRHQAAALGIIEGSRLIAEERARKELRYGNRTDVLRAW